MKIKAWWHRRLVWCGEREGTPPRGSPRLLCRDAWPWTPPTGPLAPAGPGAASPQLPLSLLPVLPTAPPRRGSPAHALNQPGSGLGPSLSHHPRFVPRASPGKCPLPVVSRDWGATQLSHSLSKSLYCLGATAFRLGLSGWERDVCLCLAASGSYLLWALGAPPRCFATAGVLDQPHAPPAPDSGAVHRPATC